MPSEHTLLVEGESDLHAVRNLVYTHDILVHYDQDIDSPGLDSCAFEIKTVDSDDTSGGQSKFQGRSSLIWLSKTSKLSELLPTQTTTFQDPGRLE